MSDFNPLDRARISTHRSSFDLSSKKLFTAKIGEILPCYWQIAIPGNKYRISSDWFAHKMVQTILQEIHPDWVIDQVNSYDPVTFEPTWWQKYSSDYFQQMEKEIGALAARAEFNNEPHVEGTIFKAEDIQYAPLPKLNTFKIIFGYWDVAYSGTQSSDYNAIVVQGLKDRDFWEIDCFVQQCKMSAALAYMCQFQLSLPDTVVS